MVLFYSNDICDGIIRLDKDESGHCVRVLRHAVGDEIFIVDGKGSLYKSRLTISDPKAAEASVIEEVKGFGKHGYHLTMAVCPPKNIERYEWFIEKATELGIDAFVPVIGRYSERKEVKAERLNRIILSATKQSLKASLPELLPCISIKDFLKKYEEIDALKLICCCFEPEGGRKTITEILKNEKVDRPIVVLIGPEGDFSEEELKQAIQSSWIPISLGDSRLRTETAALTAVTAVYLKHS